MKVISLVIMAQHTKEEIKRLLQQGFSMYRIAKILNEPQSSIRREVMRGGGPNLYTPTKYATRRGPGKPVTAQEEKEILFLAKKGVSIERISFEKKRSFNLVKKIINGGACLRESNVGGEQVKTNEEEGIENEPSNESVSLEQRIYNLEQQIEILFEIIKEKNGKN